MKIRAFLTGVAVYLAATFTSSLQAEIIGVEQFDYSDGPIAGRNGGTFWDFGNIAAPVHDGTPSVWTNIFGAPVVASGRLVTDNNNAIRAHNGPSLGFGSGSDEEQGSVTDFPARLQSVVYYRVTFTTGDTVPNFVGLDTFDFSTQTVFFGKQSGQPSFGILTLNGFGDGASSVEVKPNTTYTLVTKVDYVNDRLSLFINPTFGGAEPASPSAVITGYTTNNFSTGVRLLSGTGGAITWDNLVVSTTWGELGTVVTTTADEDDGSLGGGAGVSLREAVKYSLAGTLITFDPALNGKTCILSLGEMVINKTLTIDASALANGLTIDANRTSRHFYINGSTASLTLKVLSLINGNGVGESDNVGGAIDLAIGNLFLQGCTLSGNFAGDGGAIYMQSSGTSRLEECTLTGNRATANAGNGGIVVTGGTCNLSRCTISGNTGTGAGGGLYLQSPASVSLKNCLIAGNIDPSINDIVHGSGTLTASGNNLIGSNATVESIFSGPLVGTQTNPLDPKLSPLGHFGGPTQTMHPLIGSPAIDAGGTTDPGGTDQRGFPRFVDGDTASSGAQLDIGAVEAGEFFTATLTDSGLASLRGRIALAATTPGGRIGFLSGGTLTLTQGELTIPATANGLFIDASNLSGPVTISGNNASRVFNIAAGATVAMQRINITDAFTNDPFGGGGIRNQGFLTLIQCTLARNSSARGGGIRNDGAVALIESVLSGNSSSNGGGGLFNQGAATLTRSTLAENMASQLGGGIWNNFGTLTLNQSTLSGNSGASGGGIATTDGPATLNQSTIAGNPARTYGGGIYQSNSAVVVSQCTISGNSAGLDGGALKQFGNAPTEITNSIATGNMPDDINGGFTGSGNLTSGDARLGPLANNGGPTQTLALLAGSPAINAATGSTATRDQRGFPIVGVADLGAFEGQIGSVASLTTAEDTLVTSSSFPVGLVGTVTATSSAPSLVAPANIVLTTSGTTGTLQITPAANANGNATITLQDDFGAQQTFSITVNPVNDAPTFTVGPSLNVFVNSGQDSIEGWASNLSAGPADESGQMLTFHVSNDNNALFSEQPSVDSRGQISFTPAPGQHGVANVSISLTDDGGTDRGGVDTSAVQTFTIAVRLMAPETIVKFAKGDAAPGRGVTPGLPADAVLASFNAPAIDESGKIAFVGKWTSGPKTKGMGLFVGNGCLALVGGDASGLTGVGGAKFKSLSDPVISNGRIACLATFSGVPVSSASAVLSDVGGSLAIVAQAGSSATVDGAKFKSFKQVSIVGDAVAFLAQLAPGTGTAPRTTAASDLGLWLKDGATPLVLALREGQSVPGFTAKIKSFTSFAVGNGSPGQGRGWLQSGPVLVPDDGVLARVVFTDRKQAILRVTASGTDAPGILSQTLLAGASGSPQLAGATFAAFSLPSINSQLASTFLGTLTPNPMLDITKANGRGIFESTDSGSYVALARVSADSGVNGHAKFSVLKDPVLADDGDLAFAATLKGGTAKGLAATTLWRQLPGSSTATLFAQAGPLNGGVSTDLPAGAQWKSFPSLAIAANRGPLFTGTLVVGQGGVKATDASGLWATDYRGMIRTLFRTGDMIGGKTLKSFAVLKASVGSTGVTRNFNGAQKVVWLATFKEDKSQAIVTAEVP